MNQEQDPTRKMPAASGAIEEIRQLSVDKIAEVFAIPRHLLIEPGHVMSLGTYRCLVEAQQKQK